MSVSPARSTRKKRVAVFQAECREDLRYWVDTNRKTALRALDMIEAVMREPYTGLGKPEHLQQLGANVWSRRITDADRLVYEVFADRIEFLQARYQY